MINRTINAAVPGVLNDLVIKSPCLMDWDLMRRDLMDGDERKRLCSRCDKHVYNIEEMTAAEALELVGSQVNICARIYRRPDGTVVTSKCLPPNQKARGKRLQYSIATLVTLLTTSACLFAATPWVGAKIESLVQRWFASPALTGPEMGDVVFAVPPSNPQPVGGSIQMGKVAPPTD